MLRACFGMVEASSASSFRSRPKSGLGAVSPFAERLGERRGVLSGAGWVYGVQARGWESRHLLDVWVKVGECHPALAGEYDVQVREGKYLCALVGVYDVQVRVREHLRVLVGVYATQAKAEETHHPCPSLDLCCQHRRAHLTPISCC